MIYGDWDMGRQQKNYISTPGIGLRNKLKRELETTLHYFEFSKYDGGAELSGIRNIEDYIKKTSLVGTYLAPEELFFIKKNITSFYIC